MWHLVFKVPPRYYIILIFSGGRGGKRRGGGREKKEKETIEGKERRGEERNGGKRRRKEELNTPFGEKCVLCGGWSARQQQYASLISCRLSIRLVVVVVEEGGKKMCRSIIRLVVVWVWRREQRKNSFSTLKVESALWLEVVDISTSEGVLALVNLRLQLVLLIVKILLDRRHLLVNSIVLVVGKIVDLVVPITALNKGNEGVGDSETGRVLSELQNVLKTIQTDRDGGRVEATEKRNKERHHVLFDKVEDLVRATARRGIGKSPSSLLLDLKLRVGGVHQTNNKRDDSRINNHLNLLFATGSDVGDTPASLLPHGLVGIMEQLLQEFQSQGALQDSLGLSLVTSHNVSNHTKSGGLNGGGFVVQQLNNPGNDGGLLYNSLNAIVGSVSQIRKSPAHIGQNFVIRSVQESAQHADGGGQVVEARGRLTTAEVGKSPRAVAEHSNLVGVGETVKKRLEGSSLEDLVTEVSTVTSNVTQSPSSLFAKVVAWGSEEVNKRRNGPSIHNKFSLFGGSRGDVSQHPSSFELKLLVLVASQKADEDGEGTSFNHLSDGGAALRRQHLTDLNDRFESDVVVWATDVVNQLSQLFVVLRHVHQRSVGGHLPSLGHHLLSFVLPNGELFVFTPPPPFSLVNSLLEV